VWKQQGDAPQHAEEGEAPPSTQKGTPRGHTPSSYAPSVAGTTPRGVEHTPSERDGADATETADAEAEGGWGGSTREEDDERAAEAEAMATPTKSMNSGREGEEEEEEEQQAAVPMPDNWETHSGKPPEVLATEFAIASLWLLLSDEVHALQMESEQTEEVSSGDENANPHPNHVDAAASATREFSEGETSPKAAAAAAALSEEWYAGAALLVSLLVQAGDEVAAEAAESAGTRVEAPTAGSGQGLRVWLSVRLLSVGALWEMAAVHGAVRLFVMRRGLTPALFALASACSVQLTLRVHACHLLQVLVGVEQVNALLLRLCRRSLTSSESDLQRATR
jgi:hypothetical protein